MSKNCKRQKLTESQEEDEDDVEDEDQVTLLPGLPDDIANLCLSNVYPSILHNVCKSWRRLIYTRCFPPFLSLYTILSSQSNSSIHFLSFDPISSNWDPLPYPPPDPPLQLLLHHPSFLSRNLPIQALSVSGKLILLAATTHNFIPALTRPLIFDPILRNWIYGPKLFTPRRWCAAGSLQNVVYVASGIGAQFSSDVARSVERWELRENSAWEKMRELKDGRFSRESIDAVGWKGKLCVVNVKGVEGIFYDFAKNKWEDMPEGMIKGWIGPVAAMEEEVMYLIDESSGTLRKYDEERDDWRDIVKSDLLKGAHHVVAASGRVCAVVCQTTIVVVNVTAVPPRIFLLDTPPGFQALSVHILPRMSKE